MLFYILACRGKAACGKLSQERRVNLMRLSTFIFLQACAFVLSAPVFAQSITVSNAWVRGTVPAQTVSGAYMDITSKDGAKLVGFASPLAGRLELHEMRMEGDVMKMRELNELALPAGKTVKLDPGGYHLMLLELKQPLKPGTVAPLTLTIEGRDGKRAEVEVQAEVRALGAGR
jgi:periplasmic copper chaperone A